MNENASSIIDEVKGSRQLQLRRSQVEWSGAF
jgi:hypothetical protein